MAAKIIREKIKESDIHLSAIRVALENAEVIILSDGEEKLGTLSVSLPKDNTFAAQPLASVLLGDRNMILSRMLAERFAEESKKMTLVSLYLKTPEREAFRGVLKIADKIMKADAGKE